MNQPEQVFKLGSHATVSSAAAAVSAARMLGAKLPMASASVSVEITDPQKANKV